MLLSIVVPTVDRSHEFVRFMQSLTSQATHGFENVELIIVDQNKNDQILKIIADHDLSLPVRHLRAEKRGVSAAKNIGMNTAQGKFCCFLDDDCWLPPNWLNSVLTALENLTPNSGMLIKAISPDGKSLLPHEVPSIFHLSKTNIKDSFNTPQISHIYPTADCLRVRGFNEQLGTGIFLGSAEETDFLVRIVQSGVVFKYLPEITILHDRVDYATMSPEKSYKYGLGFGAFCRIHGWHSFLFYKIFRSFVGYLMYLPRDRTVARSYWYTLKGRVRGYLAG